MKPASFKYVAATSIEHALSVKMDHGDDAKFLAGGQSLVPAMNFRLARPAVLIDINPLFNLAGLDRQDNGRIRIGALARYRSLEKDAAFLRMFPLFAEALLEIAHPQIRNRGTIGGNLSHADPASELPAVTVALRADMIVRSGMHERRVAASEFFLGMLTTDLQQDEMLVAIELPPQAPRTGTCFMEVARRRGDYALVGVATILTLGPNDECVDARLVLCGVGEAPVDASAAAARLVGRRITSSAIEDIAASVRRMVEPAGNVHGTAAYQRHLAGVLAMRTLETAHARAIDAA